MLRVKVKTEAALTATKRLAKKVENLTPALAKAGLYMETETKLNFPRESDPDGAAWAGLSPATLKRKRGGGILRDKGQLAAGPQMVGPSGNSVKVINPVSHGTWHQTGTTKMPQRKHIGISEGRHVPRIRKIFEAHFK